jgi:hypothetical protein
MSTLLTERDEKPVVAPPRPRRRWLHIFGLGCAAHLLTRGHRLLGTHPNRTGRSTLYLFERTPEAVADARAFEAASAELRSAVTSPARKAMAEAMQAAVEARR